jgi:single-stranded-DNA-specific exonuclease
VIITDHHHVPEVTPQSFALINPQNSNDTYPFGYLCGCGVAFKVSQALYQTDQKSGASKLAQGYDKWLLDLVAIATIADMMPLRDENRVLVKYGLIVATKTKRIGLKKLLEHSGVWAEGEREITPFDVGFVIGPRINAAGRMDHSNVAYYLLSTDDSREAERHVTEIEKTNQERRDITERIVQEVFELVPDADDKNLVFAYGGDRGWPIGLAGLVAGKVQNEVGKPVLVVTKLEDRIAGSGRSPDGFDLAQILEDNKELFTTAGGHAQACGFSLEVNEDLLRQVQGVFERRADEELEGKDMRPFLEIECELQPSEITWKLYDLVQQLKPFGKENPEPVFVVRDLEVEDARGVGQQEKHLKLKVRDAKTLKSFNAIAFNYGEYAEKLVPGQKIDLACTIDVNEWNGNRELQLKVEDIAIV